MDPSTTLFTFMVQTSPDIRSVCLVGSWDNFTKRYPMDRDIRRARDQWRGCYSFKDITCDGDSGGQCRRNGGLKMGHTYWYYYELDADTETFDATLPSTTSCPYLPGQVVNLLWVPVEVHPRRLRSGSAGSISGDYKTMNPADRFLKPRPPPAAPANLPRINTAPSGEFKTAVSSLPSPPRSPKSSRWSPRQLFGLKAPAQDHGRERMYSISLPSPQQDVFPSDVPSMVNSDSGYYSRSSSPEEGRRSCSPLRQSQVSEFSFAQSQRVSIPFKIAEDEEDDDHNFAAASPDGDRYSPTILAPAPPSRSRPVTAINERLEKPLPHTPFEPAIHGRNLIPGLVQAKYNPALHMPRSHFSLDSIASEMDQSEELNSISNTPSVLEDESELSPDDDAASPLVGEQSKFINYSLPRDGGTEQSFSKETVPEADFRSPRLTFGPVMPTAQGSSLGDFLNELGYLGEAIHAND